MEKVARLNLLTLLGPVLVWSQQNYQRLLKTVGYFESPGAAVPSSPEEKRV